MVTIDGVLESLSVLLGAANNVHERVLLINQIQDRIAQEHPFHTPVSHVRWVSADQIQCNDYNPNVVASQEMDLLQQSLSEDGVTQPIVVYPNGEHLEIVDGFHRFNLLKGSFSGYVPVVYLDRERCDRMASTVRHNRARGKHQVESMSKIVAELANEGWDNQTIASKMGMDVDEVLRLRQILGLASLFKDKQFSEAKV